jgi:hypothetical protein
MLTAEDLQFGDLIVTEWMPNPTCTGDDCEWVEVYNTTDLPIDLFRLRIGDSNTSEPTGEVLTSFILEPGSYALLAKSDTNWPYAPVMYDALYGMAVSFSNNDAMEFVRLLKPGGMEVDRTAAYLVSADISGVSVSLDPTMSSALGNDMPSAWCPATSTLATTGDSEFGTPGAANDVCE